MKDLIRGTITADIGELYDAYEHFKCMPSVKIINLKQKIETLQNITVNFIFEDRIIGEMQFRFTDHPYNYHSNHFLYELHRSKEKIEILESLSKLQIHMTETDRLIAGYDD